MTIDLVFPISEGEETFGSNRLIVSWDKVMDGDENSSPEI